KPDEQVVHLSAGIDPGDDLLADVAALFHADRALQARLQWHDRLIQLAPPPRDARLEAEDVQRLLPDEGAAVPGQRPDKRLPERSGGRLRNEEVISLLPGVRHSRHDQRLLAPADLSDTPGRQRWYHGESFAQKRDCPWSLEREELQRIGDVLDLDLLDEQVA